MTIIGHELKINLKTLLIWVGTVAGCVFVFMLLFPQFSEQSAEIDKLYSGMGQFSVAFGLDKISMGTAMGFYGIEAGAMISLGGAMFAALIGIGMLSKEEGNHTAEFLYTSSTSRINIIIQKWIAFFVIVIIFNLICVGCAIGSFAIIGEAISWKEFWLYHLAQCIMHIEVGSICFGISGVLKKNNVGLGIGIAVLLYFANMFINISDKLEGIKYITPFSYSDAANILSESKIEIAPLVIGIVIGVLFTGISGVYYNKRDLNS